jgi:carbon storage regulator
MPSFWQWKHRKELPMLVLAREVGELIRIGDDIIIQVVRSTVGKVRLGITAPRDITVHREEIYEAIKRGKDSGHDNTSGN